MVAKNKSVSLKMADHKINKRRIPMTSNLITPGAPGIEPRWTSSAKSGVGTALSNDSHVWFSLSHGIFNEIYYPRIDQACIRDMGLIVTDGKNYSYLF